MRDRDSVMRGGVKPLWLRLVGVLAALAMLLTGMVATATADAADNASGDVTLADGSDVKGVIKGRLDADGWTPDLSNDDPDYVDMLVGFPKWEFYGWNSKADGTGDWYIFDSAHGSGDHDKIVVNQAPTTPSGKLEYPSGGKLYAQWLSGGWSYDHVQLHPSPAKVRRSELADLTFTTSGWGAAYRGYLTVNACAAPFGPNGGQCLKADGSLTQGLDYRNVLTLSGTKNLLVRKDGTSASYPLGAEILKNGDANAFLDAAYANPKIKYLSISTSLVGYDGSPREIGVIALDRSVAPAPDVTAPVFAGVSDVTVDQGVVFDSLAGVSARDDRDGDVTSAVTVSPSAVDTSEPGETTLTYTVKDKAGNTATVSRVVRVKTVAPDADRDLTGDTRDDGLIGLGVVAPGAKVTLQLPADYAGRTGDVYVYSTPTVLAVGATVSDEGTLGVTLPAGLPAGVHRIVFKPYDASLPLVWDSFEVRAAQEKPAPSTPGKTDATAGRKPAAKQPLPDTGSDVALVGVAVLVLAVAAGIVLAVRRRG